MPKDRDALFERMRILRKRERQVLDALVGPPEPGHRVWAPHRVRTFEVYPRALRVDTLAASVRLRVLAADDGRHANQANLRSSLSPRWAPARFGPTLVYLSRLCTEQFSWRSPLHEFWRILGIREQAPRLVFARLIDEGAAVGNMRNRYLVVQVNLNAHCQGAPGL